MPLCPRCGAAHQRDDDVCRECGKRLRTVARVTADQTALAFPTCGAGPDHCQGPVVEDGDGVFRCTFHQTGSRPPAGSRSPTCSAGPAACSGDVARRDDGQVLCDHHHDLMTRPRWRRMLARWF